MSDYHPDRDTLARDMAREIAREEIQRALSSPMDFPQELKNWIPGITSIAGLQIPFSDIVGQYVTSSTVSGLGAGVHGRIGMVQAGASPYDYIMVTYDAAYGKWVGNPFFILGQTTTAFTTSSTTYVECTQTPRITFPWRTYDTAGLTLQARHIADLDNNTGGVTTTAVLVFLGVDAGAIPTTAVEGGTTIANTGTTEAIRDTGWYAMPAVTLADFLVINENLKCSSGAAIAAMSFSTKMGRWVSK